MYTFYLPGDKGNTFKLQTKLVCIIIILLQVHHACMQQDAIHIIAIEYELQVTWIPHFLMIIIKVKVTGIRHSSVTLISSSDLS